MDHGGDDVRARDVGDVEALKMGGGRGQAQHLREQPHRDFIGARHRRGALEVARLGQRFFQREHHVAQLRCTLEFLSRRRRQHFNAQGDEPFAALASRKSHAASTRRR